MLLIPPGKIPESTTHGVKPVTNAVAGVVLAFADRNRLGIKIVFPPGGVGRCFILIHNTAVPNALTSYTLFLDPGGLYESFPRDAACRYIAILSVAGPQNILVTELF